MPQEIQLAAPHPPRTNVPGQAEPVVVFVGDAGLDAIIRALQILTVSGLIPSEVAMEHASEGGGVSVRLRFDPSADTRRLSMVVLKIAQLPCVWDVAVNDSEDGERVIVKGGCP